jgi:ATP-dependent Clp protease ATP-binding subunit ClpC
MLYGEVGPGQIVLVDVEGEGKQRAFTFRGTPKTPLPEPAAVGVAADVPPAGDAGEAGAG